MLIRFLFTLTLSVSIMHPFVNASEVLFSNTGTIDTVNNAQRKLLRDSSGKIALFLTLGGNNSPVVMHFWSYDGVGWGEYINDQSRNLTGVNASHSTAVIDSGNNLHVVLNNPFLYIVHSAKAGEKDWTHPQTVSSKGSSNYSYPDLVMDNNDNPHVAWSYGGYQIYFSSLPPLADNWTEPVTISASSFTYSKCPQVIINGDDEIFVIWTDAGIITYSKFTAAASWSSPDSVSTVQYSSTTYTDSLLDSEDNIHLFWAFEGNIYYSTYASSWSVPEVIVSSASGVHAEPSVGIDQYDNIYLVWLEENTGMVKFTSKDKSWGNIVTLSGSSDVCYAPSIVEAITDYGSDIMWYKDDGEGEYHVVYMNLDTTPPYLTAEQPGRGQKEVKIDTNIEFILNDDGAGINISSVTVIIDGNVFYEAGTADTSYASCECVDINSDYKAYKFTFNPLNDFAYNEAIQVKIIGEDLSGARNNVTEGIYSFTTESGYLKLDNNVFLPGVAGQKVTIDYADYSADGNVTVKLYTLSGELVKTVVNGFSTAGPHSAEWDGTDSLGTDVASGIYMVYIETPNLKSYKKVAIIK